MNASDRQMARSKVALSKRWVVKIGSALLTDDGRGLDREAIAGWVAQMHSLRQRGVELVLVSSGSVAEGMARLGWKQRPKAMHDLQAAAAVGQMGLVQAWEQSFQRHGVHTAQVLVTHEDLSDRKRYLNARNTLLALIGHDVVPVVNENDTVVTDEIRFGDNDTLGALTANLVEAELLVILTDQEGMFDADPRQNSSAKLISCAKASDSALHSMAGGGAGVLGRGGMATKLRAAQLAARSGAATVIAGGRLPAVLERIQEADEVGTLLLADDTPMAARKQWLAGHLQMRGVLTLDAGATKALREKGVSLLPVGVREVKGNFYRGEMVACVDPDNQRVACGLVNYSAEEARQIMGLGSENIAAILGYVDEKELIHRDNMVVL
nr:glutamate 5-kinase [Ketobacter sp. MCCC 1A13808]